MASAGQADALAVGADRAKLEPIEPSEAAQPLEGRAG